MSKLLEKIKPDPPFIKRVPIKKKSSTTGVQLLNSGRGLDHPEANIIFDSLIDNIKRVSRSMERPPYFINKKGDGNYKPIVIPDIPKTKFLGMVMERVREEMTRHFIFQGKYNTEWIEKVLKDDWTVAEWVLLTNAKESFRKESSRYSKIYSIKSFALLTRGNDSLKVEHEGWDE